jgi:hypothetical protein
MMTDVLIAFIPIIGIILGLGTAMLAIFLNYKKRKEMFALYHQERMAAIDKGIELPPLPEDFFRDDGGPSRRSSHRTLLVGLVLVFIGVTGYIAIHFSRNRANFDRDPSLFALVPAGCGVAYLIYYFTVGRKLALEMEQERKARLADSGKVPNPRA